jgi:hypothetical protein
MRYIQAEVHMMKEWAMSSILQIRRVVAFSMASNLEHTIQCSPNHGDLSMEGKWVV